MKKLQRNYFWHGAQLSLLGVLAYIMPAQADNCGSLSDCFYTADAAVNAGFALAIIGILVRIFLSIIPKSWRDSIGDGLSHNDFEGEKTSHDIRTGFVPKKLPVPLEAKPISINPAPSTSNLILKKPNFKNSQGVLVFENYGDEMSSFEGVKLYRNGISEDKKLDGEYQCVQYVKRFFKEFYNQPTASDAWRGDAKEYTTPSELDKRDLIGFKNGAHELPKSGDIIAWNDGGNGHVAIVVDVKMDGNQGKVGVVEQNWSQSSGYNEVHVTQDISGGYTVADRGKNLIYKDATWSRLK